MKKALSFALALTMCLGLTAPSFAAGETSVKDEMGIEYALSQPVSGVETWNLVDDMAGESVPITVYVVPEGTVITPKMIGSISDEAGQALSGTNGVAFTLSYELYDWSGQSELKIDEAGFEFTQARANEDFWYYSDGGIYRIISWLLWDFPGAGVSYNPGNRELYGRVTTNIYFRIGDSGSAGTEKPVDPQPSAPSDRPLAKAGDQDIEIDGVKVAFQTYMLADESGNGTNYVKLRDIAHVLNGTPAQFSVGYSRQEQSISATTGAAYKDTGTEMDTPFAGADKEYVQSQLTIVIDGAPVQLDAITLVDDAGNGYNYFKLRDLGEALGFTVGYSRARGVYVETK